MDADTSMLLDEIRAVRVDVKETNSRLISLNDRTARVEARVEAMECAVKGACAKANGAAEQVSNTRGQWKVLLMIMGGLSVTVIGYIARGLLG